MTDVFREVDEEVRREQWQKLWRTYGKYAVGAAVVVALAIAGGVGWTKYQEQQRMADSGEFTAASALVAEDQAATAADRFARLASEAGGGYVPLARLRQAEALAATGDIAGAVAVLDKLAADGGVEATLRDVAALHAVYLLIDDGDPADVARRLKPLLRDESPWRNSARELEGLLALRRGDTETARRVFSALTEDATVPVSMRSRAAELLAIVGLPSNGGG